MANTIDERMEEFWQALNEYVECRDLYFEKMIIVNQRLYDKASDELNRVFYEALIRGAAYEVTDDPSNTEAK